MMITSSLNAKRFAGKPLQQPLYRFDSIPKCNRDLEGSTISEIINRDDFVDATAEMVLLCNEAMRRSKQTSAKKTSKPLSLEYIADRLDIDDPMTGFFVRDQESKLQGFITCTTFTNWQKSFRWDSVHEASFSYDDDTLAQHMLSGERVFDADGTLGAALQQTIHCGDPWNEGIVWPRIAEISLLGGLGCGKALLSMALERLETLKATGRQNYDYVVLQATENSVPFYESMGFVRVGALTVDSAIGNKSKSPTSSDEETESDESAPTAVPVAAASPAESLAAPSEIVSSPVTVYVVEKAGESPLEIAKKFNVSVWDVVYLNHYVYKDLTSRSWLKAGTSLYIPSESKAKEDACTQALTKKDLEGESSAPKWYVAFENDTPKSIARKFGVACKALVEANIARLPELLPISRLKEGTRIKVSHFHLHEDHHVPYCHWTFPDDKFENAEPSYMMAKKIERRSGNAAKIRPVQSSLAVPVSKYVKPPASLFHVVTVPAKTPVKKAKAPKPAFNLPGKPKRPLSAYIIFCNETRASLSKQLAGKPATEYSKILAARWKQVSDKEKAVYQRKHASAKKQYEKELQKYERNLERFFEKHPEMRPSDDEEEEDSGSEGETLFNQVVTVKPGTLGEAYKDVEYFYVLTYIPDLVWCHLAPMRLVGYWGDDKPQCQGRPIWMLVDESEGKEVDISASFCQQVKSRGMKRTVDADNEQWDIPDSGRGRKLPANFATSGKGARSSQPGSSDDSAKKPRALSSAPTKQPKLQAKQKKRKRSDTESSGASSASSGSSSGREGDAGSLSKGEDPAVEGDKASPPPKKRKAASPLKKLAKLRQGTRDLPRRKAAPRAEGIFSEAKSPVKSMADVIFYDPGKRFSGKQRKDPPTHSHDNETAVQSAPPPDQPLRRAPKKSLKKRGATIDEISKAEVPTPSVRRAPKKTLKKRGSDIKISVEDTVQSERLPLAAPARRAPKKTLKRRGAPLSKRVKDSQLYAEGDTKAKDVIESETESEPRGVHRELPRRKAAASTEGFYSESPSKNPTRNSQLRNTHASLKARPSPLDRTKQQGTRSRSISQEARSLEAETNAKSEPNNAAECARVISPSKASVLEKLDELEPFTEKTNTSTTQTKIDIHFRKGGASNPKKRARAHECQHRVQPKRAKVEPLATRPLRNRKATDFFAGASLGISSPLAMRHRLVAS